MKNPNVKTTKVILYDELTGEEKSQTIYTSTMTTKEALIAWIMQYIKHDYNTWNYPNNIEGITESKKRKDTYYYTCKFGILQAI